MAICLAIQKWCHYLLRRYFIVLSDQQSLRHITHQREVNMEYQKWLPKLLGFDFEVQFKPKVANKVADALSRKQVWDVVLNSLMTSSAINWQQLEEEVRNDQELQMIVAGLERADTSQVGFM